MKQILRLIPGDQPNECSFKQILEGIAQADDVEVQMLLDALRKRTRELNPEWDLVMICVPKNDYKERRRIAEFVFSMFDREEREQNRGSLQ